MKRFKTPNFQIKPTKNQANRRGQKPGCDKEILRKSFQVMLNSKSYTYQSLRVKPLEISYSSVNFFSDRDEVLLVSEEFVLTEELGIHQCGLPTSEEYDSPEEFERSNFRPLLCYVPAVLKYLFT